MSIFTYIINQLPIILTALGIIILIIVLFTKLRKREQPIPYELAECILTQTEQAFYHVLLPITQELGLTLFVKVRLADIAIIPKGTEDYMKWFNKIRAKHVDFLLCDEELEFLLGIELEDSSHLQEERIERDNFVDNVYEKIGLPLLHVWEWDDEDLCELIVRAIHH